MPSNAESRDAENPPPRSPALRNIARRLVWWIYGETFNPMITLRALSFFGDGDLARLPEETQRYLAAAAAAVREIPTIGRISDRLGETP